MSAEADDAAERAAYRRGVIDAVDLLEPWRWNLCPLGVMCPGDNCRRCWKHAVDSGDWPPKGEGE